MTTQAEDQRKREARADAFSPEPYTGRALDWVGLRMVGLPVWVQALIVYVLTRLLSLGLSAAAAEYQGATPWNGPEGPNLIEYLNFWDAGWYERIWTEGYPSELPRWEDGRVAQNAWAFYPLYPWLVGPLGDITGMGFKLTAVIVSLVCGAVASVLILHIFRIHVSPCQALTGLLFFLVFPATTTLMAGYAESLTIMLLALALLLVIRRHYYAAIPVVVLMDESRPIGVGFSFFMLLHLIDRLRRRKREAYPVEEVVASWTLGVASCAAALIHPLSAWVMTGVPDAYFKTETSWSGAQYTHFVVWIERAERMVGGAGGVVFVAVLALFVLIMMSGPGRSMGRVSNHFVWGYAVYLLIFFNPQTSTFRMLLPMFPMALVLAVSNSWALKWTVLGASVILQVWWLTSLWGLSPGGVTPP